MESSILDWELLVDSRADGTHDAFLDELEKNIRNEAISYPAEEEQRIVAFLLEVILQPLKREQANRSLALYVRLKLRDTVLVSAIADQLYDYFVTDEHSEVAFEALKTLITELPPVDFVRLDKHSRSCQMALRLVESLAPRVTGGITKDNVTESMTIMAMLLRHFGPIFRNHAKLVNMMFLPDSAYFCTGVELGKGSYANVFLGRNIKTAEVVAIKTMDWDKLTQGRSKLCKQLENEITVMRDSDHPNIVKLYDVVRQGCYMHLILEYCGGGSLEEYLYKKGALPEEETLHWLRELALGLKFLHDRSIIHRDLKPGNLLLSVDAPTAKLKITDFTFARFIEPGDLATTLVGTPLYMAPEIFLHRQYTEKSDLWSVGVILYQMLTGSIPYKGSNILELVEDIKAHEPIWPEGVKISADMKDLLKSLLQRDATLRITWTEFFMHPLLKMMDTEVSTSIDDMESSLMQSVICQEMPIEEKELAEARETLRGMRAELDARSEELKAVKKELAAANEKLALSEDVVSDLASRLVQMELATEELQKTQLKLVAEKKVAEQKVEELKAQVLLLATNRLAEGDKVKARTEELQASLNAEKEKNEGLVQQVGALETQLEVYKVALESVEGPPGVEWKAIDWRSFLPFKGK